MGRLRGLYERSTRLLDWAADWRDRVGILVTAAGALSWATVLAVRTLGFGWGVVVGVGFVVMVLGLVLIFGPRARDDQGPQPTLIPPGWNAIVTGEQAGEGEWVPPGFKVTMGPGAVSDEIGNAILGGADSRIYRGTGSTIGGSQIRLGERPY